MGARIAVIGCGHIGTVVAAGLAKLGHTVVGLDRDEDVVSRLSAREVLLYEPGLRDLLAEGLDSGRLTFDTSFDRAIPDTDVIFLTVDTPALPDGAADLRNIRAASGSIASAINRSSTIVVNKSTSPIGTGEMIEELLANAREGSADRGASAPPRVVSNPEFLREGRLVEDFFAPSRIVVGSRRREDAEAVARLYEGVDAPLIVTDLRTAEMIKYVSNAFLATRISFVNEIAQLSERLGVEIDDVAAGVALDPRIGPNVPIPGIGFGGGCLPKDVAALRSAAKVAGLTTPLLAAVQEVNEDQRTNAVRAIRAQLGTLEGRVIGVWGVTFKGGTEDTRDSPAMEIIHRLRSEGATIQAYDPSFSISRPDSIVEACRADPLEAARGADLLAILSDWDDFRRVPLSDVMAIMKRPVVFDGRNVLDRSKARAAGFVYVGVGRPSRP